MNIGAEWPIPSCPDSLSYEESLAQEKQIYENCANVHQLPAIFHYWSNRHLRPKLQTFGFASPADFFAVQLGRIDARPVRFLSLGAGNCDLEIDLARSLEGDFTIDCLDLNPAMLSRGREAAEKAGVLSALNFAEANLNTWSADAEYHAVIANQSLHHVVNLEGLFEQIKRSIRPGGQFLISDMIGRNGHQRWPEALAIIHEFWRRLPPSYRFNQLIGYYEEMYENWDCSVQGFEGVRSQDILPLLLDRFHFRLFVGYGNVIDPFIDRAFGVHFDPAAEWDRSFIDEVHQRDEEELISGRLKPTHMITAVTSEPSGRFTGNYSPKLCVRQPSSQELQVDKSNPYRWGCWPQKPQLELEIACDRLAATGREIERRTAWALSLNRQLEDRTAWALSLDRDARACSAWALRKETELSERTDWALTLRSNLEERTAWALDLKQQVELLEEQVEERTLWALRLKQELAEQISRAERLERENRHFPIRLLRRILRLFGR